MSEEENIIEEDLLEEGEDLIEEETEESLETEEESELESDDSEPESEEDEDEALEKDLKASQLKKLKARAKELGIQHHPNIGIQTLSERIKDHINDPTQASQQQMNDAAVIQEVKQVKTREAAAATIKDEKSKKVAELKNDALSLVRVEIMCMDPMKKEYSGEYMTVSNSVVGTQKRYVAYNAPWHIPKIMFNMLKEKKFRISVSKKLDNGATVKENKMMNMFNISILDPLTKDELKEMERRHIIAENTSV